MIARLLVWNLGDSKTAPAELRGHLEGEKSEDNSVLRRDRGTGFSLNRTC